MHHYLDRHARFVIQPYPSWRVGMAIISKCAQVHTGRYVCLDGRTMHENRCKYAPRRYCRRRLVHAVTIMLFECGVWDAHHTRIFVVATFSLSLRTSRYTPPSSLRRNVLITVSVKQQLNRRTRLSYMATVVAKSYRLRPLARGLLPCYEQNPYCLKMIKKKKTNCLKISHVCWMNRLNYLVRIFFSAHATG